MSIQGLLLKLPIHLEHGIFVWDILNAINYHFDEVFFILNINQVFTNQFCRLMAHTIGTFRKITCVDGTDLSLTFGIG